jgi:hypothetical protein
VILGRTYDVPAANTLGRAVFTHLRPGTNLLLTMFPDPAVRGFYADWERAAANTVAGFRYLQGAWPNDLPIVVTAAPPSMSAEGSEWRGGSWTVR